MNNQDIADVLNDIADLLDLQKVEFKPRAFRRASQTIRSLTVEIKTIEDPTTLPTIGKGISGIILDLLETGKSKEYDDLKKKLPPKLLDLFDIPGLGPKSIARLYHELKVTSINQLEKAVNAHKVAELKGFGHKTEYEILEGIALVRAGQNRMILGAAYPVAHAIQQMLHKVKGVEKVEIVGSLARAKETIGDIDILCASSNSKPIMEAFTSLPNVTKIIAKGTSKSSILIDKRIQVDLRVLPLSQFGAAKQYFTGSKQHNVKLRQIAIKQGLKLNEYGLFNRKTNNLLVSKSEEAIYRKLGLQCPPPEIREDGGELELAKKKKLPILVKAKDILGDFHMHTKHSDGANSVREMADALHEMKYKYAAITDHSKTSTIARGNTEKEILKEITEIEMVNKTLPFKLMSGSEVDILADGSLDFSNSVLKKLDVVVASVHSGFKKDNTKRIIRALENSNTHILGHMTGRLINQRKEYPLQKEKILQTAKDNDVAVEINSQPMRLDANAETVKMAIEIGCTLAINSDAHSTAGLNVMQYGVATARRGWAEKKNVLNTWSLKKVQNWLER